MATNRRAVHRQANRFRATSQYLVHAPPQHPTLYSVALFRLLQTDLIDTLGWWVHYT